MKRKKNIILIGFMGCGKTSTGLKLSYRLQTPVEDTDKLIEQREGRTISEIFAVEGEEYFRELETVLLREISVRNYTRIISVGGGTPMRRENRVLLKSCGVVVYLRIRPETVYERLRGDMTRPLLQCDNPLEKISTLLDVRSTAYEECADIIIDVDGYSTEQIIEELLCKLEREDEKG